MYLPKMKLLALVLGISLSGLCYIMFQVKNDHIRTEILYQFYKYSGPILPANALTQNSPIDYKYENKGVKMILYYTKMFKKDVWTFGEGQDVFKLHKCPVTNCLLTSNKSALPSLSDFDALLFNYHKMDIAIQTDKGRNFRPRLPEPGSRSAHQRYVLHMFDPPPYSYMPFGPEVFEGYFNWTMSYRLDSDLPRPYGWFERHDEEVRVTPPNIKDIPYEWVPYSDSWIKEDYMKGNASKMRKLAEKPRKIAMMVSHCPVESRRLEYAKELQKYIDVGILGRCGSESCNPKRPYSPTDKYCHLPCEQYAQDNFKYYLSFENSLCDYYSSEKFWKHGLQSGLVPIVLGRGYYKDTTPPHSYIDVTDFESPKALADYINYLEENPLEYLLYLWWQNYYRVRAFQETFGLGSEISWVAMCELCKKLNDPDEPAKVIDHFYKLTTCHQAPDWTEKTQEKIT